MSRGKSQGIMALVTVAAAIGVAVWLGCTTTEPQNDNSPPQVIAPLDTSFVSGGTMTFSIQIYDPDGDPVVPIVTNTQANKTPPATFNTSTQTYSWVTTVADSGIDTITVVASDGIAETKVTIYVRCTSLLSQIPVIQARTDTAFIATDTLRFTINATDPNGQPVTVSVENKVKSASIDRSALPYTYVWATTANDSGFDTICISATDGQYTAYDTVRITCLAVNPGELGLRMLEPKAGDYFRVGDTMTIKWSINFSKITKGVRFGISPNGNKTTLGGVGYPAVTGWGFFYFPEGDTQPVMQGSPYYIKETIGQVRWVIPDSILNSVPVTTATPTGAYRISLVSMGNAMACVQENSPPPGTNPNQRPTAYSSGRFTIAPRPADTTAAPAAP